MRFAVEHTTRYRYDQPVWLGPHDIRLRPRHDGSQRLLSFSLSIEPTPTRLSEQLDPDGNVVTRCWFQVPCDSFTVRTAFTAETIRANPFDYWPDPGGERLPMILPEGLARRLAAYLAPPSGIHPEVVRLANGLAEASGYNPLDFLARLNGFLFNEFERVIRKDGDPYPPHRSLAERRGACRDLSLLFIDACCAVGIPARFVSGYGQGWEERPERYMHAWPEVFVPGGGWRGYDPTLGLAVLERHVAVAAAADFSDAAPISGGFSGGSSVGMDAKISIQMR
ncbi:transglutaminase family protein [Methylomagnum sp.]